MLSVGIPFPSIQPLKFIPAITFTLTHLLFPLGQLVVQPLYHGPERVNRFFRKVERAKCSSGRRNKETI